MRGERVVVGQGSSGDGSRIGEDFDDRKGFEDRDHVMGDVVEHGFTCPGCWAAITMLLDLSGGAQTFVEDCEVCCRPLVISFAVADGDVARFEATLEE